jgi:hypothetical protein
MNFKIAPKETEIIANWDDAKLYCSFLAIDGKNDWRLPTTDELKEIYQLENDLVGLGYWSSTETDGGYGALYQSMSGTQYPTPKSVRYFVRAVRDVV